MNLFFAIPGSFGKAIRPPYPETLDHVRKTFSASKRHVEGYDDDEVSCHRGSPSDCTVCQTYGWKAVFQQLFSE